MQPGVRTELRTHRTQETQKRHHLDQDVMPVYLTQDLLLLMLSFTVLILLYTCIIMWTFYKRVFGMVTLLESIFPQGASVMPVVGSGLHIAY